MEGGRDGERKVGREGGREEERDARKEGGSVGKMKMGGTEDDRYMYNVHVHVHVGKER